MDESRWSSPLAPTTRPRVWTPSRGIFFADEPGDPPRTWSPAHGVRFASSRPPPSRPPPARPPSSSPRAPPSRPGGGGLRTRVASTEDRLRQVLEAERAKKEEERKEQIRMIALRRQQEEDARIARAREIERQRREAEQRAKDELEARLQQALAPLEKIDAQLNALMDSLRPFPEEFDTLRVTIKRKRREARLAQLRGHQLRFAEERMTEGRRKSPIEVRAAIREAARQEQLKRERMAALLESLQTDVGQYSDAITVKIHQNQLHRIREMEERQRELLERLASESELRTLARREESLEVTWEDDPALPPSAGETVETSYLSYRQFYTDYYASNVALCDTVVQLLKQRVSKDRKNTLYQWLKMSAITRRQFGLDAHRSRLLTNFVRYQFPRSPGYYGRFLAGTLLRDRCDDLADSATELMDLADNLQPGPLREMLEMTYSRAISISTVAGWKHLAGMQYLSDALVGGSLSDQFLAVRDSKMQELFVLAGSFCGSGLDAGLLAAARKAGRPLETALADSIIDIKAAIGEVRDAYHQCREPMYVRAVSLEVRGRLDQQAPEMRRILFDMFLRRGARRERLAKRIAAVCANAALSRKSRSEPSERKSDRRARGKASPHASLRRHNEAETSSAGRSEDNQPSKEGGDEITRDRSPRAGRSTTDASATSALPSSASTRSSALGPLSSRRRPKAPQHASAPSTGQSRGFHQRSTSSEATTDGGVPSRLDVLPESAYAPVMVDIDHDTVSSETDAQPVEAPLTPLSFVIPDSELRKANEAAPDSAESFWRHKLYKGPDGQTVLVHYCRSKDTSEREAQRFASEPVVGFDLEWQVGASPSSGIKANVALIQLACEGNVGLFHVALHRGTTADELIGPVLKGILENPAIIKAGVNIRGDSTRLTRHLNVGMKGLFELSHLYRLVTYGADAPRLVNKRVVRLADQVQEILGLPLHKGDVRTSNWNQPLSAEQCTYAASDAYAGFRLFHALEGRRWQMDPRPPRPHFAELNLPITLPDAVDPVNIALPESDDELSESEEDAVLLSSTDKTAPFPPDPMETDRLATLTTTRTDVQYADDWISKHPEVLDGQTKPSKSALRAYVLWHVLNMEPSAVASILRQPPLKLSTVCTYILESVKAASLEYDKDRVEGVLRDGIPEHLWWKYKGFAKKRG